MMRTPTGLRTAAGCFFGGFGELRRRLLNAIPL